MKKSLLLAAAVGLTLVGCNKSMVDNGEVEGLKTVSLTVSSSNEADSRTSVTPDADNKVWNVQWSKGDVLGVFAEDVLEKFPMTSFTDATGQQATFTGTTAATEGRLVYPYNPEAISGSTLKLDLSSQECDMKNDFSTLGANINMISSDVVSLEEGVTPNMKHIGAAMQLNVVFSDLVADTEYRIDNVEVEGMPATADINLLSAISSDNFMTATEGVISVDVVNSKSIVAGEAYKINLAVLPFTLAVDAELSVKLNLIASTLENGTTKLEKVCTVANTTGSELVFGRALHHTLNVDCSVEGATVTAPTSANGFFGTGNAADPYQISTKNDMLKLVALSNEGMLTNYFVLTDNIDLEGSEENPWTAISTAAKFKGHFDGANYTVSGLYVNNTGTYGGLFGQIGNGASVKNVNVEGTIITSAGDCGGIVGKILTNSCVVDNCSFRGVINNSVGGRIGGITGWNNGSTISNCYTNIYAEEGCLVIGGIVADNKTATSIIVNCVAEGVFNNTKGSQVGGIAANNNAAQIYNSINKVQITGMGAQIGGIVGLLTGSGTIVNCINIADITTGTSSGAGGILSGSTDNSTATISNCVNYGTITASNNVSATFAEPDEGIIDATSFYLEGSAVKGAEGTIIYSADVATVKTAEEFASADFAALLNTAAANYNTNNSPAVALCGWDLAGSYPVLVFNSVPADVVVSTEVAAWTEVAAPNYGGGLGTEASPYVIASAEELAHLAVEAEAGDQAGVYFILSNNIDLAGKTWTSISGFAGEFNYNGYVIKNATSAVFAK